MTQGAAEQVSVARRAAAGAGWIIAWRMATRNLGLLSTLILVRLLEPLDFGLVALAMGFINAIDALSAIGVEDALVRTPLPDRDAYDTGFTLNLVRGLLTALIVVAIAWPVADFVNEPRLGVVMLALSAATVISAFENIGVIDFRRDLAFRKEFDMQVWSRIISVVTTITVAAVWHTYWALVAGILVNRIARLVQTYLMSPYRPHVTFRAWRQLIGFSLWAWAQTILTQVRDRTDTAVVGRFLGAAQVGVFSIGFELGFLPSTEIVEPLGRALFSGFASLHNANQGLQDIFLGAVGLGFLLVLPASLGISMVAEPMVCLTLGAQWVTVVPIVQILAVTVVSTIFTATCATLLNAIGKPDVTFYVSVVSTIARVLLLFVLVPTFGLSGAAMAISGCVIIDLVVFLWITLPRIMVTPWQLAKCLIRPAVATAAMVAALWWLSMAWTPSRALDTIALVSDVGMRSIVGAVCYATVLGAAWIIAGRPDGPERYILTVLTKVAARCMRLIPAARGTQK
jgi:lipopolysaccharide exporter